MTEHPQDTYEEPTTPSEGGRRRKRRSIPGCLAVLVALAVVAGGFYFVVTKGIDAISDKFFSSAEDYDGPGRGKVSFEVADGDVVAQICRNLKKQTVVASVDACLEAANANADSNKIQVGLYPMKKEMAAEDAIAVLVDPDKIIRNNVTIPEGLRVDEVVQILSKSSDYPVSAFDKVLDDPSQLGLPDYAEGNPEGYLFPSTYDFGKKETPLTMLTAMVDQWERAASDAGLEAAAGRLGYTPAELMVVASLVEAEGRGDDMSRIARVIYNRLEGEETNGLLQIDATVNYAADNELGAVPTTEDLELDSPYNTYKYPGLPPTPIEAPGASAMKAAAHPAEGGWYYYVTVNLATGETKFAETYDEFLGYKDELREYCETESEGAC